METTTFNIEARSCTLRAGEKPLLTGTPYVIPVYQRPYAWGHEQVRRLFKDLVGAYQNGEPAFLGTMQLMPKADEQGQLYWEIVDGQQRLTTLLLLFKVLHLHYGPDLLPEELRTFDWLSTRVSGGEQQQWLAAALAADGLPATPEEAGQNRYLANAVRLAHYLQQAAQPEEGVTPLVVDAQFINHVLGQLYVVVITTQAGLAKTLDIFNTINTAGMDLNGGDVFKIQLFEYLTRQLGQPDSVFADIDALYAAIDAGNKQVAYHATDIQQVLEIYKYILIERVGASRALHDLGTTTFYERLFACLLLGEKPRNFDREKMQRALGPDPLADLNRLMTVYFAWETQFSAEHNLWYHLLIHHTRYGWRYWLLDIVYLFRFYQRDHWDAAQFEDWNRLLVRYYMVKTIQFRRAVNEAHGFTYNVVRAILSADSTPAGLTGQLRRQLAAHNTPGYRQDHLLGDVFENAKQRYLILRLLALVEEDDWNSRELFQKFFHHRYDVEHIRPRQPRVPDAADDHRWASHLNRLGNLVLLEESLNRSEQISNHPFAHKWVGYEASKLRKVAQLRDDHRDLSWTVEKCAARTQHEADKLMDFLFAGCAPTVAS